MFTRSTDYNAIYAMLTRPACWRRMHEGQRTAFEIGPRPGAEYVLATERETNVAVFVILEGIELHFCMIPEVWGRTLEIAKAFLRWAWANLETSLLVGPVPRRNRLALSLAKRAGFKESDYTDRGDLVYLYIQRPGVTA